MKRRLPSFDKYYKGLMVFFALLTTIGGLIQMKRRLPSFDKYYKGLMIFFALLTTIATFLIWNVSRKQTELTYLMGKAAQEPIIQIDYDVDNIHEYTRKNNLGSVVQKSDKIWVIQVSNIGKGPARNLKIEQRGKKTREIGTLEVGQKRQYPVLVEEIRSKRVSAAVKVTYQDIFENEFTIEY